MQAAVKIPLRKRLEASNELQGEYAKLLKRANDLVERVCYFDFKRNLKVKANGQLYAKRQKVEVALYPLAPSCKLERKYKSLQATSPIWKPCVLAARGVWKRFIRTTLH